MNKHFAKYPVYVASIHAIGGLGVGILIARPYVSHPVRVGLVLIAVAVLGHIFLYFKK